MTIAIVHSILLIEYQKVIKKNGKVESANNYSLFFFFSLYFAIVFFNFFS